MDLQIIWFILIVILFTGYAVLDGFDFGVGILHLGAKNEDEKRINLNAIGPFWDGNEVWLLTAGGALFAAFPVVYATVFSGFYLALMLVIVALIFRAVALEFRSKVETSSWRNFWDKAFGIASFLAALLFGVALGNIIRGIPIDSGLNFTGNFTGLLNPFAILVGVLNVILVIRHGAIFMTMKTDGEHRDRMRETALKTGLLLTVFLAITLVFALISAPAFSGAVFSKAFFWIGLLMLIAGMILSHIEIKKSKHVNSFVFSCMLITGAMIAVASGLFPNLVPSSTDLENSLTIYNSSSTNRTLLVMLIIAITGMPLVIAYQGYMYWIFRGKPVIEKESY